MKIFSLEIFHFNSSRTQQQHNRCMQPGSPPVHPSLSSVAQTEFSYWFKLVRLRFTQNTLRNVTWKYKTHTAYSELGQNDVGICHTQTASGTLFVYTVWIKSTWMQTWLQRSDSEFSELQPLQPSYSWTLDLRATLHYRHQSSTYLYQVR